MEQEREELYKQMTDEVKVGKTPFVGRKEFELKEIVSIIAIDIKKASTLFSELISIIEISCLHLGQVAVYLLVDLTCNIEKLWPKVQDEVSTNQTRIVVVLEDSWRTIDRRGDAEREDFKSCNSKIACMIMQQSRWQLARCGARGEHISRM
ncbi:hypothetical protein SUGI_0261530 [Cryptomeria japonica]|nr:hypothetical protein SUGI_0261530 [Cryptomeria japonica]